MADRVNYKNTHEYQMLDRKKKLFRFLASEELEPIQQLEALKLN